MIASAGDLIGGRYRLDERLGQGATGVVWRADELFKERVMAQVAVKIFLVDVNDAEIVTLAKVQHGHILAYRTTVDHQGRACLVTEYADGGDMQKLLQAYPQGLPEEQVAVIWDSIAKALQYLHEHSWVHRDVKPSNILYVGTTVKLGDVGIAKLVNHTMTRHTGMGTVAYSAPEMFNGQVGAASDVYSLGVTAFELLTGRIPFVGAPGEVMRQHLQIAPAIPAHLPSHWQSLLRGSLEKEPARRMAIRDLRLLLRGARGVEASPGQRQLFDAVCAECGAQTQVPFRPSAGRPVYCRDCYSARKRRPPERRQPPSPPPKPVPPSGKPPPEPVPPTALELHLLSLINRYPESWENDGIWRPFWRKLVDLKVVWERDEREAIRLGEWLVNARKQQRTHG